MFITQWNEQKFPEIVQRIYNAIFVNAFQICLIRTKKIGESSTRIHNLNHEHQKELSKIVNKMQVFPLG